MKLNIGNIQNIMKIIKPRINFKLDRKEIQKTNMARDDRVFFAFFGWLELPK